MTASEKAVLYRELAKLSDADFHLDRSLDLLLGQRPPTGRRLYLEGLKKGLAEGLSVAEAVARHNGPVISDLERALVDAGERSGRLGPAFNHLARYFSAMDSAARQARGAMVYPLVLLHLAVLLPELPVLITATEGGGVGERLALILGLLWGGIALLGVLWRWLADRARTSPGMDAFLGAIPWIGAARRHWALARFTQVFHSCLLAALRMSECTAVAARASQSGRLLHAGSLAAEHVEAGGQVAESLAETGAFPPDFVRTLGTAEATGKLDEEMARWMVAETLLANEAVNQASLWLPKIGYGVIVLFVAWRIVSMFQGIYSGYLLEGAF